jgi:hypothetical protein
MAAQGRRPFHPQGAPLFSAERGSEPFLPEASHESRGKSRQAITTRSGSACLFESEGLGQTCPQVVTLI